jgi:hypothetical protein
LPLYFTLNASGEPEPCYDVIAWGEWLEGADRTVARDRLSNGAEVSTVFLGLDHNFTASGPPVLWETMIFGGPRDGYCDRATSRAAALVNHAAALELARAAAG